MIAAGNSIAVSAGGQGSSNTVHFNGGSMISGAGVTAVGGGGGGGGGSYIHSGSINIVPGSLHFVSWNYEPAYDPVTYCDGFQLRVVPATW